MSDDYNDSRDEQKLELEYEAFFDLVEANDLTPGARGFGFFGPVVVKSQTAMVMGCLDLGVFDKVVLPLDFASPSNLLIARSITPRGRGFGKGDKSK